MSIYGPELKRYPTLAAVVRVASDGLSETCKIMEEGVHRGRWNKSALVGIILLLMCKHVPASVLLQPSVAPARKCPDEDYSNSVGICCNKCFAGTKFVRECNSTGHRTTCEPCPKGEFTDQMNYSKNCRRCKTCKASKHEELVSECERNRNTICCCKAGYYKYDIDSESSECRKCSTCRADEKEKQKCTPESNTVCECTEMYYRVNNKCEPCKNCTAECGHLCIKPPINTKAPNFGNEYLINIIFGIGAVAVVMFVLVIVITYVVTKWLTKKRLLQTSSQPSDDSPDSSRSFTLLIPQVEPANSISVEALPLNPVTEQEQLSNLPDCVPLEIKITDLIYTVLDLVPVLRVKQLVRSLGVKDSEIEQVELDYRSCREAHYQMMRIWTERGSRAGGMLHWPLLQELLNELKKMHLGRAAEELETKYGIQ